MQVVASGPAHFLRYRRAVRWTPEKIRDRREDLGLTQLELAQRLGVSLRTVTAWEAGDARPQRPSKLDAVLGQTDELGDKSAAELIAEINERLTALARLVPSQPLPGYDAGGRPNLREHLGKYVPEEERKQG